MARPGGAIARVTRRRLATVMFIDIAQSTELATQLGDRRWADLLSRFRGVVRHNLKTFGGREQDTAGDGFYATFDDPSAAVLAAAACMRDSNKMGVNVRAGLHTGECDFIDGRLGGVAAAIGSRVVSVATPGQIVATGTVRDLLMGGGVTWTDIGTHELKGVDGPWRVFAVTTAAGEQLPQTVAPTDALDRIAEAERASASHGRTRRRHRVFAGIVVATAVMVGVPLAVAMSGSHVRAAKPNASVYKVDPVSSTVLVSNTAAPDSTGLYVLDGTLWQTTDGALIERDPATGDVRQQVALPLRQDLRGGGGRVGFAAGLHQFWIVVSDPRGSTHVLEALSPLTGKVLSQTPVIDEPFLSMGMGSDAVWDISVGGDLRRIAANSHITNTWATNVDSAAGQLVVTSNPTTVWIATDDGRIYTFSPTSGRTTMLTNLHKDGVLQGAPATNGDNSVWFLTHYSDSVYCVHNCGGQADLTAFGVGNRPTGVATTGGDLFVAAGNNVYRIDLSTGEQAEISLPSVIENIAADSTGKIWVDNCFCSSVSVNQQGRFG